MLTSMDPRTGAERKAHARELLSLRHADAWVSTASNEGLAHLVPLSYAWDGRRIILATRPRNPTALNVQAGGRARVAIGHTRDVVMMDTVLESILPVKTAGEVAEAYAAQGDWDPRETEGEWVFILLRPVAIQAWREANELEGREIMREGNWLF
jgi:hypothetical protein